MTTKSTALDARINTLKPGGQITLSEVDGIRCLAERSGDGRTLRFVREAKAGSMVFRTRVWAIV